MGCDHAIDESTNSGREANADADVLRALISEVRLMNDDGFCTLDAMSVSRPTDNPFKGQRPFIDPNETLDVFYQNAKMVCLTRAHRDSL